MLKSAKYLCQRSGAWQFMKILKTARPWPLKPKPQGIVSSESHCDLSVTGVLHHSIFCIKIRSLPDLTISWLKNLIFSDKVLIAFRKAPVNFWGIILYLWLRINNPSKFCMSQLYIAPYEVQVHFVVEKWQKLILIQIFYSRSSFSGLMHHSFPEWVMH